MSDPDASALLRSLLDGTGGWWSCARLRVDHADGLVPAGTARLLLRRPLMGVPAGVRVEDAGGRVLARALGEELDDRAGLRALLDPLALVMGLPPAVGALPARARREAAGLLDLSEVRAVVVDGVPAVSGRARRPVEPGTVDRAGATRGVTSLVLDRVSGLPLEAGPAGGPAVLALRVEELDPRLVDDTFEG